MDKISILLVDNPCLNITKIDSALNDAGLNHTLYFAGSGRNGLDILMGDPFYELITADSSKIKPNIVILSKELRDISAIEFLGIVGKYYSLRDVKIFLLSDSLNDKERFVYEELGVIGFLERPLDKEQIIKEIRPHVNGRTHFAFMPVAAPIAKPAKVRAGIFIKEKIAGMGVGAKIAACITSALVIGGVARFNANERIKDSLTANVVKMPQQVMEPVFTTPPSPAPAGEPKVKPAVQKQAVSLRNEVAPAISSVAPDADSMIVSRPISEPFVPSSRPNLRIIVVEEPDSIQPAMSGK
jgi:CheY-like chemotaxis protein